VSKWRRNLEGIQLASDSGGEAERGERHQHRAGQHDTHSGSTPPSVFFAPTPAASDICRRSQGEVLDMLFQRRRDSRAALRLMRKLLKKQGFAPKLLKA
jgi:hypothetical protein